ncbi:XRE family transcriptional regulator [Periweissella cryptocerci]|uniref:XRE family transcriptional regulator n=1 Tax=Periweissella cryptocerci TaxID=2506420 RepID=A0A4P6YVY4_9LACO|nr:helix-turn-helix transcriptional regulator [Periweissella cryptocerci]QBO36941.1 XRE family transcriptional regulator [Periweissella cryptocerci]
MPNTGFTARLEQAMEQVGMTQRDLAETTNINKAVINRIILGTRPARDNEITAMAEALNVSTDWLLKGTHSSETNDPQDKNIDLKKAIEDEDVLLSYDGKPIPDEYAEMIKKLLS